MKTALALLCVLGACGKDDTPGLDVDSAEITVTTAAGSTTHRWSLAEGNFVHCEDMTHTLFVRLAMLDREDAARADFDICHFHGAGHYDGLDPFATPCTGDATFFDVFWHTEHDATVHVNNARSTDCSLELTQSGGVLEGQFQCHGLAMIMADPSLDVAGSFRCTHP